MKCALIIVDMQNAVKQAELYKSEKTIETILEIANHARIHHIEVIYVRHIEEGDKDFDLLAKGSEIIKELTPQENETVILKHDNSSFKETELDSYLQSKSIDTLILTGAMTEYCFDTTVRVAFEKGYNIYIPKYGHTTSDSSLSGEVKYHFFTKLFNICFAKVVSIEEIKKLIETTNE